MLTKLLIFNFCIFLAKAVDFQIENHEGGAIWVGILGNAGQPTLRNGGFILDANKVEIVNAPENWAGRFWARTWCDANSKHCLTGDCGNKLECNGAGGAPPATLAEITLKGDQGKDFYDISLVDGFNLKLTFEPVSGQGDGSPYSCKKAECRGNINPECPNELKLNSPNGVVGCKSACIAFNQDDYCCRGAHGTPDKCHPDTWQHNYAKFFKDRCPDAYSYAYDDPKSTFTCKAQKYIISFGG